MSSLPAEAACPTEEDIAAFLCGAVDVLHTRALEAHFAQCSLCRRLLSALARAAALESRPEDDSVSPTVPLELRASETELQLQAPFGRYMVLDWLGAGGMGVVYAAYDPELSRRVALKVLRAGGADQADRLPIRDLLVREARAMAQLAHPNVVTVFDVGSVDDRVFIAMELVEGQTLSKWLRAQPRTPAEILSMFVAAGNGLAAAHAAGLLHRDFKPDNVLVGNDGRVRVTDFGLARPASREPFEEATSGAPHTGLAGTLAYMAPERYQRRSGDARADQFSFAVALYEALHGERPFSSPPFATEAGAARPAAIAPRRGGVTIAQRQVLLRALSLDPEARYPSMTALLAALTPRPRRARRVAIAAIVAVALAVIAAGGHAFYLRHAAEERIELVGRLRGLALELRAQLRGAKMLPRHDIRPSRDGVRSAMRDVERQLHTRAGQAERAVVHFVLGEGHRVLGEHERALELLEAAWAGGVRGSQIDAALGDALGVSYWKRLEQIERSVPAGKRALEIREIEQRYRVPAMAHLRAAVAARTSSPKYLEALIAFDEHRFDEASRGAHAALTESPTSYEAGMLEARAHSSAGRALVAAGDKEGGSKEFGAARRIFEGVLEIARSDDEAWLAYGQMVFLQAHDLASSGELAADLRRQAIDAFRVVRQINPDRWEALLGEIEIHQYEANQAIVKYQDPRPHVDNVLARASEARAHGAASDQVDVITCLAHWWRAVYEGTHGMDPRQAYAQAIADCERAAAVKPDADKYSSLGVVYSTLAGYEADRGHDATRLFELGAQNFRASLAIVADAVQRYNLGRVWSSLAHAQSNHGGDPQRAVASALAELDEAMRMDSSRGDALAARADALIPLAQFHQAAGRDASSTIAEARAALDRALAIDAKLVPPIKYRLQLAALEAEALLGRNADPTPVVRTMRDDAKLLLRLRPDYGFARRLACQTELLAARWALARGAPADDLLARATLEATLATQADPTDAMAWTTRGEVEQLRAEAARAHGTSPAAALASGRAFIDKALQIDARLVRTLRARDALAP